MPLTLLLQINFVHLIKMINYQCMSMTQNGMWHDTWCDTPKWCVPFAPCMANGTWCAKLIFKI